MSLSVTSVTHAGNNLIENPTFLDVFFPIRFFSMGISTMLSKNGLESGNY